MIQSTLGLNYHNDHKEATNAYFLWVAIKEGCKPKGSGTLNDRYRRLLALKLSDFKDASEYAGKFKELHNEIRNMHEELRLNENFLIFLFHTGLGKEHEDYFLHYTQNHSAIDAAGRPAWSLEYATQRFIQTVTNPSASRTESTLGMVATRPEAFVATTLPSGIHSTIGAQSGAVEGPNSVFVRRLVKFCAFCRKLYHTQYKCQDKNGHPPEGLDHSNRRKRSHSRSRNDRHDRDKRYRLERRSNRD